MFSMFRKTDLPKRVLKRIGRESREEAQREFYKEKGRYSLTAEENKEIFNNTMKKAMYAIDIERVARGFPPLESEKPEAHFIAKKQHHEIGGFMTAEQHHEMGVNFFHGKGVPKDSAKAVECFSKAADQGYTQSIYTLARMYADGNGVSKDISKARFLLYGIKDTDYKMLNIGTQFELGHMYDDGIIVSKDLERAVMLYQTAADQGHAFAQNNLGLMYKEGRGVSQSDSMAIDYFLKAAKQGDFRAQLNLSDMGILPRPTFMIPIILLAIGIVMGLGVVLIHGGWIGYLIMFLGFLVAVKVRVSQVKRWDREWNDKATQVRFLR